MQAALNKPVAIAWLAVFRALFGLAMALSVARFIAYGWIDTFFVEPKFHFKYYGFEWIEAAPPAAMHALFWILLAAALCLAVGFHFRISAIIFFAGFTYLQLIDVATYLNHYYLACLLALLLAVSPANRAFSIDIVLKNVEPLSVIPAFWLYLFRFQVGVVYTFAGLAKLNSDWLLHAQPLSIWLASRTGMPIIGPLFAEPWAAPLMSWAGFLFDTTVVWFLLCKRTRLAAYLALIIFHVLTRILFPIGMFPVIMILSALVFFPPNWPRREIQPQKSGKLPKFAPAAGIVFVIIQLALPLRSLVYRDNVHWHEQGIRFSWRVMVREKNGSVTYYVKNKETGRVWHVNPSNYLTQIQARELSSQPDLILQLAHHIRDDFKKYGPVEVRAEAWVSLNGRPSQLMIDPEIDLAAQPDSLRTATYISTAPTNPPRKLSPLKLSRSTDQ